MKLSTLKLTVLAGATLLLAAACTQERPAAASAKPAESAKTPLAAGKVARIVFVDLDKCCACTRKRIDKTWQALTAVVGFPPVPDVERIHMDTQADKAAPYKKQRPIMVPPAIYFFDGGNKLVEFLQGEIKEAKIRSILK